MLPGLVRPRLRRTLPLLGAVLLLAGCGPKPEPAPPPGPPPPPPRTAWPMTRGGAALSGVVARPAPARPTVLWTFTSPSPFSAEAAIANGRIYVGNEKGRLHCLDAETGKELWHFDTGDTIAAAPAVTATRVFVSSHDGRLYALEAATGKEAWKFATDQKVSSGATLVRAPQGTEDWVVLNGYDGTTRVLRAADGSTVWTYATEDHVNGAPAVVDGRFIVFGGCDAQLHVVQLADGKLAHRIPAEAYIPASIGTSGTMAFCGNHANQVVAFEVAAGKVAWTYQDRAMPFYSSPAVTADLVIIGSRDKHLHAIRRATGEAAWKFRTGGRVEASPIAFTDAVVFASTDGRIYAAALADGTERWQLELGEALIASPAFGEDLLVVGGEKGTLFALRGPP